MHRKIKSHRRLNRAVAEAIESRCLLSTTPVVVDLLAVYTPNAAAANGGDATLQQLIRDSIDTMNKALIDSQIALTVRLVHTESISYSGSNDLQTDLNRLRNQSDGFMDSVHGPTGLRNTWGADLVTLITDGPSINGGIANLMTNISDVNNPTFAFSAIAESAIGPGPINVTLAHELGHNLGAGHERGNLSDPAVGPFSYSYGYRFTAGGVTYHDIMSYDPGIAVPYFANPNVTYQGSPTGSPIGAADEADLASTFLQTAPIVAAYRGSVVSDSTGPTATLLELNRSGAVLQFTVRYADDTGINLSTLDSGDITVTGPGGFVVPATFVSMDHPTVGGAFRFVTYQVVLPATNPATSSLTFNLKSNAVRDINNNAAVAVALAKNTAHIAGTSYALAQDLGTLSLNSTRTEYGRVQPYNNDSVYRFTLGSSATVSVGLTGMTDDADVFIARDTNANGVFDNGEEIRVGFENGDEGIAANVTAGTYFVWVYQINPTVYTLSLTAYNDVTAPTATLDATDLKANAPYIDFAVTYSDNFEVDGETSLFWAGLEINGVLTGGGGFTFWYYPDSGLNTSGANAPSKTMYYRILPPVGSSWTSAQNGVYTVKILTPDPGDPRLHDAAGNNIAITTLGSFRVGIGTSDTAVPTATLVTPTAPVPGQTTWDFQVVYKDNVAINATTVDNSDVRVTGPNSFNQLATLVSLSAAPTIGSGRVATYRVTAPGGFWDGTDDGTYTIALQANQVRDTASLAVAAVTFGGVIASSPNLMAQAPAGTVAFNGTGSADTMRLRRDGSFVYYTLNDQTMWFTPNANVTRAVANGLASNDTISIEEGTFTGVVSGGAGDNTLTVNNATLILDAATGSGSDLRVNVGATGTVRMASGGSNILIAKTLSITTGGKLDLTNNDLVVNTGSYSDILNAVIAGFGTNTAITSSTSNGSQILALFDNALVGSGDWEGNAIGAAAIVGKYTYFGDANLDGQVTGDDYTVIDANLSTTPPAGLAWLSGDMNLDGTISGDDYTVIDANLGLGVGNPLSPPASALTLEPNNDDILA